MSDSASNVLTLLSDLSDQSDQAIEKVLHTSKLLEWVNSLKQVVQNVLDCPSTTDPSTISDISGRKNLPTLVQYVSQRESGAKRENVRISKMLSQMQKDHLHASSPLGNSASSLLQASTSTATSAKEVWSTDREVDPTKQILPMSEIISKSVVVTPMQLSRNGNGSYTILPKTKSRGKNTPASADQSATNTPVTRASLVHSYVTAEKESSENGPVRETRQSTKRKYTPEPVQQPELESRAEKVRANKGSKKPDLKEIRQSVKRQMSPEEVLQSNPKKMKLILSDIKSKDSIKNSKKKKEVSSSTLTCQSGRKKHDDCTSKENVKKAMSQRQIQIQENKRKREEKMEKAQQQRAKLTKEKEMRLRSKKERKESETATAKKLNVSRAADLLSKPERTPRSVKRAPASAKNTPKQKTPVKRNAKAVGSDAKPGTSKRTAQPKDSKPGTATKTAAAKVAKPGPSSKTEKSKSAEKVAVTSMKNEPMNGDMNSNDTYCVGPESTKKTVKLYREEKLLNTTVVKEEKTISISAEKGGSSASNKSIPPPSDLPSSTKLQTPVKPKRIQDLKASAKPSTAMLKQSESYEITPARESFSSYDISEIKSDSEDEEESDNSKPIPSWANGLRLRNALLHQLYNPIDTDELFGNQIETPNLEVMMGVSKKWYKKRTSSAVWNTTFT